MNKSPTIRLLCSRWYIHTNRNTPQDKDRGCIGGLIEQHTAWNHTVTGRTGATPHTLKNTLLQSKVTWTLWPWKQQQNQMRTIPPPSGLLWRWKEQISILDKSKHTLLFSFCLYKNLNWRHVCGHFSTVDTKQKLHSRILNTNSKEILGCFQSRTELHSSSVLSSEEVHVWKQISEWDPPQWLQTLSLWPPRMTSVENPGEVDVWTQQRIPAGLTASKWWRF